MLELSHPPLHHNETKYLKYWLHTKPSINIRTAYPYLIATIPFTMNLNSSDKGCALLTGSIVLENGRILDENKPRLLTFDGHIYIPGKIGGEPDELLVIVRFFARQNNFSGSWPDVGNCFIHTVVITYIVYLSCNFLTVCLDFCDAFWCYKVSNKRNSHLWLWCHMQCNLCKPFVPQQIMLY